MRAETKLAEGEQNLEAAGIERELAGSSKCLMALGFWANSREVNGLGTLAESTQIP